MYHTTILCTILPTRDNKLTLLVDVGETGSVVLVRGTVRDEPRSPAVLPAGAVPHIALQARPGGAEAGLHQQEEH